MRDGGILILKGGEVLALLSGQEQEIIGVVRNAYETHAQKDTSLPHSTFLRFPDNPRNRIIALPSYLGGKFAVAGMKWISSFPGNLDLGVDRASAAMILNSTQTGRLEAIVEGSVISAKRTAASAALAAQVLHRAETRRAGLIGTGRINFEVVRFLRAVYPELSHFVVFDLSDARAAQFAQKCESMFEGVAIEPVKDLESVLKSSSLLSFATTALTPYLSDLSVCAPATTILHVSLRDLTGEAILASDNVVDDVDHVCRAETSVHLAEQLTGNRHFIRGSLAEVMNGTAPAKKNTNDITVFSPFGLGILDIAIGKFVCDRAHAQKTGTFLDSFPADSWLEETASNRS
jgi:2,3-diaminopropionate biosynthesis protein SbnB